MSLDPNQRGFNIADFVAYRKAVGHLRTNNFIAVIPWPGVMARTPPELVRAERQLELACESINFPSTGLVTYGVQRYSYGAVETKPTLNKFSPLQCTFVCDEDANIQKFFHEWIKHIANYEFYDSIIGNTVTMSGIPAAPYEISYKEEYSVDLHLHIYSQYGDEQRHIRFREAYPIDVGDVQLNWGRKDEIIKIPVVFTFFDWTDMDLHPQAK